MKFTYNWLKDFVEIRITAKALAEKLTMAGLEVTSLEEREGDSVFEIEVTSNRPDWLSVVGIAREVAAITNSKFKLLSASATKRGGSAYGGKRYPLNAKNLQLKIEDKKDCPLYTAKIIREVKVGPSPDWLRKRLELIGCRSVNNIVDITNYILFTYGEPLHAFDLDKLNPDAIMVRRAKENEKLKSIDGEERILNKDTLVIADKQKPIAIAGVIGGKDSEVTQNTKNILLEAAIFDPIVIRRTRQKLGIQTDSSYRFERGIAIEAVESASLEAARLIKQLAGGDCVLAKSSGSLKPKTREVKLNPAAASKILGQNIPSAAIKKILTNLGFKVKNNFIIFVPSYRQDVKLEIDLIEEIARIYGYDRIPATLPKARPELTLSGTRPLVSVIKNTLVGLGLNEVITYSLIDRRLLDGIEILNPLSQEQGVLRPQLLASLSLCIDYNLNQKQEYVAIFEIAKTFLDEGNKVKEELSLGIGLCGVKTLLLEQGLIKDEAGFLHLKGILEKLFEKLGIAAYAFKNSADSDEIWLEVSAERIGKLVKIAKSAQDAYLLEVSLERLFSYANL